MKKVIAIVAVFALFGGFYLVDFIRSKQYEYELVSQTNEVIVADGVSPTKFTVRLTRNGQPVAGHTIGIVASNGTLRNSRLVTDGNGEIVVTYYAFLYLNDKLTPMGDVTFYFSDEDNSKVIMVPAKFSFTVRAEKPEDETEWEDWQEIVLENGEEDNG